MGNRIPKSLQLLNHSKKYSFFGKKSSRKNRIMNVHASLQIFALIVLLFFQGIANGYPKRNPLMRETNEMKIERRSAALPNKEVTRILDRERRCSNRLCRVDAGDDNDIINGLNL